MLNARKMTVPVRAVPAIAFDRMGYVRHGVLVSIANGRPKFSPLKGENTYPPFTQAFEVRR